MPQRNKKNYNAYMKEYMLKRYHTRRKEAIDKLGGKCIVCGNIDSLEIDHKDFREKKIKLNKMWSIAKDKFYKELEKCQLLCYAHHREKSLPEIGVTSLEREAKKRNKGR